MKRATLGPSESGGILAYADTAVLGNPATNYFYLVRSLNLAGAAADSNRVGEFDFALQPGNP